MDSLGKQAKRGARWQAAAQGIDGAVSLGTLVLLARLIAPDKFGIAAVMVVVTSTFVLILVTPIATALIAKRLGAAEDRSTAFWLAVVPSLLLLGPVITVLLLTGLPHDVKVAAVLFACSVPCLSGASLVTTVLQQDLAFRALAAARIASSALGAAIAIAAGVAGAGVVALGLRAMVVPFLLAAIGSKLARWAPSLVVRRETTRVIARYGRSLLGFNIVNQVHRKGDDLLISVLLNPTALGLYSVAYRFIETPISQVAQMATNVTFPVLMRVGDPSRFAVAFLRSQKILVYAIAPMGICSIALGEVAVPAVLGDRWVDAGRVVQIFGVIALLQAAETQLGVVFQAMDANRLHFLYALSLTPVFLVCLLVGLHWGLQGAAWGYAVYSFLAAGPLCYIAAKLLAIRTRDYLRSLVPVFGIALGVAGGGLLLQNVLQIKSLAAITLTGMFLSAFFWMSSAAIDTDLRHDVLTTILGPRGRASG